GRNLDAKRRTLIDKALRKTFPPEFINRIDEIVFFNSLSRQDVGEIVDIELEKLKKRVDGWDISFTPALKKAVSEAGFDPEYGARPLRRAIQKLVEDPVSAYIISHPGKDKVLKVDMDGDLPVVSEKAPKLPSRKKAPVTENI
ncbi:MAG: ATP-dependent Clp protease ATP-binding subunit, partial [Candidatus Cryptobacteroides sp.]